MSGESTSSCLLLIHQWDCMYVMSKLIQHEHIWINREVILWWKNCIWSQLTSAIEWTWPHEGMPNTYVCHRHSVDLQGNIMKLLEWYSSDHHDIVLLFIEYIHRERNTETYRQRDVHYMLFVCLFACINDNATKIILVGWLSCKWYNKHCIALVPLPFLSAMSP